MTPAHFLASEYRRVIVQSVFGDLFPFATCKSIAPLSFGRYTSKFSKSTLEAGRLMSEHIPPLGRLPTPDPGGSVTSPVSENVAFHTKYLDQKRPALLILDPCHSKKGESVP